MEKKPPIRERKSRKELERGSLEFKNYHPRGLFQSADGYIIHSDVNGSFNIGRVAYPLLCNSRTLTSKNMLLNPISVGISL